MKNHRNYVLTLSSASFLALGLFTAAIGPALDELSAQTGSSLAAVGGVFTALFLGALASQVLGGSLIDRIGPRPMILGSMGVLGGAVLALTQAHALPLLLGLAAVAGLGHGMLDIATHVLVSGLFAEKRASALNLLNVFFGVGAFVSPALAGLTLNQLHTALPSLGLGGAVILLLLAPAFAWLPRGQEHLPEEDGENGSANPYTSPRLWVLGALILLYVGIENGMGGWSSIYLQRTTQTLPEVGATVVSGFWLALTVGRIAATWLGTRLSGRTLLALSLLTALAGGLLLRVGYGAFGWSVAGILLLGFGFGPVFPTSISLVTAAFPRAGGKATGLVVAFGSLGGMVVPWLQGLLIESPGPGSTPWLAIAAGLGMLGSLALAYRVPKNRG